MKRILFFAIVLMLLGSCVNQRQRSNITGRTDEVYFTPSDTRIKGYLSRSRHKPQTHEVSKSYTGSYADRLHNFGSGSRFKKNYYGPLLTPSLTYSDQCGWSFGYLVGDPYYSGSNFANYGRRPSFVFTYNQEDYYLYNSSANGYNSRPFGYNYYGTYYNPYYSPYRNCSFNKYHYPTRIGLFGSSKPNNSSTSSDNTKKKENTGWWKNSSGSPSSGGRNTPGNTNSSARRR